MLGIHKHSTGKLFHALEMLERVTDKDRQKNDSLHLATNNQFAAIHHPAKSKATHQSAKTT